MRCGLASELDEGRLQRAHQALALALAGDARAFDEAEQTLASAASLTDAYPLFALEATRRLRERRFDDAPPTVKPVFEALVQNDLAAAERALALVPPALAGRAEFARLVAELRALRR